MLCGLSFFAGLIVTIMDKEGVKQLNKVNILADYDIVPWTFSLQKQVISFF